jgi:hypothetical protein
MHNTETDEWSMLCERLSKVGFEALSKPEQFWIAIRELIDSTENGGLISYFYNSAADHLKDCFDALDVLDAGAVKELLVRQCTYFGGTVPETLQERNSIIEAWEDGEHEIEMDEIDHTIMPLLEDLDARLEMYLREQNCIS